MGSHADPRLTESDAQIIQRKARRLVGHYGYRACDVEDLEQELATHVFQQTPRYDPTRGSREKFISKIVKNKILHLVEHRTAQKRDTRRDVSVDSVGEGVLLDGKNTPDRIDVVIDVREVIARLPEDLRQAALLRQHHSEKELEELLGLTRGQVRSRIQRIKRVFREAGLTPDSDE